LGFEAFGEKELTGLEHDSVRYKLAQHYVELGPGLHEAPPLVPNAFRKALFGKNEIGTSVTSGPQVVNPDPILLRSNLALEIKRRFELRNRNAVAAWIKELVKKVQERLTEIFFRLAPSFVRLTWHVLPHYSPGRPKGSAVGVAFPLSHKDEHWPALVNLAS
jgi:hypothetical protein